MKKFYFLLFLFPGSISYFQSIQLQSNFFFRPFITQNSSRELKGKILDAKTGIPLPYASIWLAATAIGTLSDTTGHFILMLKEEQQKNIIQISAISYKTKGIEASKLLAEPRARELIVYLTPVSTQLTEVQIKARSQKFVSKKVGSQIDKFTSFHHVFKSDAKAVDTTEGPEIGIPIYFKKYPVT